MLKSLTIGKSLYLVTQQNAPELHAPHVKLMKSLKISYLDEVRGSVIFRYNVNSEK